MLLSLHVENLTSNLNYGFNLFILQALVFLLALVVRAANRPEDYDSDDEYIGGPRQQIRQPLVNNNWQSSSAQSAPVAATVDSRAPSRTDAWSARMREKVCSLLCNYFLQTCGHISLLFRLTCLMCCCSTSFLYDSPICCILVFGRGCSTGLTLRSSRTTHRSQTGTNKQLHNLKRRVVDVL